MNSREKKARKKREELSRIFGLAIRTEQASQKMYTKAISFCEDPDWKSLLSSLRADEAKHEKELRSLFAKLLAVLALEDAAESAGRRRTARKSPSRKTTRARG